MTVQRTPAPELVVESWFNTATPLTLAGLRGRIVLLHTFQMLCPGCVAHALPQAEKLHRMFAKTDLRVIDLHTVFEHHAAMTAVSLKAFIHEYRLTFPIGIDQPAREGDVPVSMATYGFRGTPSTVLIDRAGFIRHQGFGQEDDLSLGARIGSLLAEMSAGNQPEVPDSNGRDSGACLPR